jgi:hypothetical protein
MTEINLEPTEPYPLITAEDMYALGSVTEILPLPESNQKRTQRVLGEFGLGARSLVVGESNTYATAATASQFYPHPSGPSDSLVLLKTFLQYPDSWLPMSVLEYVTGTGFSTVKSLNRRLGEPEIIDILKMGRNVFAKMAPDVIVLGNIPEKTSDVVASQVMVGFQDSELAYSIQPDKFVTVTNIGQLNRLTQSMVDKMAAKNPKSPFAKTNKLVFTDDKRAEIAGQDYESGTLAMRSLHRLLRVYFTAQGVPVEGTAMIELMRSLAARGIVILHTKPDNNTVAHLLPVLIDDRRQP